MNIDDCIREVERLRENHPKLISVGEMLSRSHGSRRKTINAVRYLAEVDDRRHNKIPHVYRAAAALMAFSIVSGCTLFSHGSDTTCFVKGAESVLRIGDRLYIAPYNLTLLSSGVASVAFNVNDSVNNVSKVLENGDLDKILGTYVEVKNVHYDRNVSDRNALLEFVVPCKPNIESKKFDVPREVRECYPNPDKVNVVVNNTLLYENSSTVLRLSLERVASQSAVISILDPLHSKTDSKIIEVGKTENILGVNVTLDSVEYLADRKWTDQRATLTLYCDD